MTLRAPRIEKPASHGVSRLVAVTHYNTYINMEPPFPNVYMCQDTIASRRTQQCRRDSHVHVFRQAGMRNLIVFVVCSVYDTKADECCGSIRQHCWVFLSRVSLSPCVTRTTARSTAYRLLLKRLAGKSPHVPWLSAP